MAKQPRSLANRVVAITGGARGIGRCTAEALVREGARVAIGDIDLSLAQKAAEEIGNGTVAFALDVTDRKSFAAFIDEVESALGPVDVLINNAGIMPVGPFLEEEDAVTDREIDINLRGVIHGMKVVLPRMIQRGQGHVVNMASAAGKVPLAGEVTYCATKHAVVGLSEALVRELRGTGIEISVVMPSLANTELASGMDPGRFMKLVEPEHIAHMIVKALKFPKLEVYVPKRLGRLIKISQLLPRSGRRAMERVFKTDEIGTQVDVERRAAYVARSTGTVSAESAAGAQSGASEKEQVPR